MEFSKLLVAIYRFPKIWSSIFLPEILRQNSQPHQIQLQVNNKSENTELVVILGNRHWLSSLLGCWPGQKIALNERASVAIAEEDFWRCSGEVHKRTQIHLWESYYSVVPSCRINPFALSQRLQGDWQAFCCGYHRWNRKKKQYW